jgi:hypothetical protein
MKHSLFLMLAGVIITATFGAAAYGADTAAGSGGNTDTKENGLPPESLGTSTELATGETPKALHIRMSFYGWFSCVSTEVQARDTTVSSDVGFGKIVDALDFANFAHLELKRGDWGLFSEVDFVKLSNDTDFRAPRLGIPFKIPGDGVLKQTMIELGAMRSFEGSRVGFDALAGARYFNFYSKVHAGPFESTMRKDWIDPMFGGRLRYRITDKWTASLRGDVSGFGVGSELTLGAVALLSYSFTDRHSFGIGYRYLDIDYKSGKTDLNIKMYGPLMGVSINF